MCHGLDHILNTHSVLIESDWNLNVNRFLFNQVTHEVLIESDWNLNLYGGHTVSHDSNRINRIRLEFKDLYKVHSILPPNSINRIRLEFKVREEDYSSREDRRY